MFKNKKSVVLGCFSPPVMIATFLFELISMIYVLVKYKLDIKARIISALLLNLAVFQMAEYFVCQNSIYAESASRVGYVAITVLPVLGFHLMSELSKSKINVQLILLYILAFFVSAYFLFHPESFKSYECTGNYVIFQIGTLQGWVYSFYYFGLILATILFGLAKRKTVNEQNKRAILMLILGYISFIIPVAIITVFHPDTRLALPSILCGFAVFFAIILVMKIVPSVLKKR